MPLEEYRRKRKFGQTSEPEGARPDAAMPRSGARFVVQKHAARRLHYDFRLEVDGVLKSWAVPKGPSLNPADKRLAVMVEDHPLDYADFEGEIPKGNYGAGTVIVWDQGSFFPEGDLPAAEQIARGELKLFLQGAKLRGSFALVRMRNTARGEAVSNQWLLIKHRDASADPAWRIEDHDGSVLDGEEDAAGLLEGAKAAPVPTDAAPMLATLVDEPPSGPDWLFELKWDGMRALAFVSDGRCELRSRAGRNVTDQYPELAALPGRLRVREAVLDGEIVVLDGEGRADFALLQKRMHVVKPAAALLQSTPVDYYLFDILYCDGYDLRAVGLAGRKKFLRRILRVQPPVRFSDHVLGQGGEFFELARKHGTEGIVGKQLQSPYVAGRGPRWVKVKATRELDAVVGGYTEPRGGREHFGALLLGLYDGDELAFIGSVGSGFTEAVQSEILGRLAGLDTPACPFRDAPTTSEPAHWVRPQLVARVQYAEWTPERRLRQPVFRELREDVEAGECLAPGAPLEEPVARAAPAVVRASPLLRSLSQLEEELARGTSENVSAEVDGKAVSLSNLNKVYFPGEGLTKRGLLYYYFQVAGCILPFLKNRPLVLRRHPNGVGGKSFYQKEAGPDTPEWMSTVSIPSEVRQKETRYYVANDLAALLFLANLGSIEHNPWSSPADDLERPDYVFFDLDPTEEASFDAVVEVARTIGSVLEEIGCKVFLKTSGATGFHMYLPLERAYDYGQVRSFAEILARLAAARKPDLVTLDRFTSKRAAGKIYVDYSQNAYGRPLASVYSVRPVAGATVSAPVSPRELKRGLSPSRFTMRSMPARLKKTGDLWANFWKSRQRIEPALENLKEFL